MYTFLNKKAVEVDIGVVEETNISMIVLLQAKSTAFFIILVVIKKGILYFRYIHFSLISDCSAMCLGTRDLDSFHLKTEQSNYDNGFFILFACLISNAYKSKYIGKLIIFAQWIISWTGKKIIILLNSQCILMTNAKDNTTFLFFLI